MKREVGILLQRHGAEYETRAHERGDDGGGRWLNFVNWSCYKGKWSPMACDSLSSIALEALRLHLSPVQPPGGTPDVLVALGRYGRHDDDCTVIEEIRAAGDCSCGFDAAVAAHRAQPHAAPVVVAADASMSARAEKHTREVGSDDDSDATCRACKRLAAECECTGGPQVGDPECTCYESWAGHQPGCYYNRPPALMGADSGTLPSHQPERSGGDALSSRRAQEATPENTLGEAVMLLRKYGDMENPQVSSLIPQALWFLCERCSGRGWLHGDAEMEGGMPIECHVCAGTGKRAQPPGTAQGGGDELRPVVQRFAQLMESKLRENDDKGGWKGCGLTYLTRRLNEEWSELRETFAAWHHARGTGWPARVSEVNALVGREAADVANFAMMIADVCGALEGNAYRATTPVGEPPRDTPVPASPPTTCVRHDCKGTRALFEKYGCGAKFPGCPMRDRWDTPVPASPPTPECDGSGFQKCDGYGNVKWNGTFEKPCKGCPKCRPVPASVAPPQPCPCCDADPPIPVNADCTCPEWCPEQASVPPGETPTSGAGKGEKVTPRQARNEARRCQAALDAGSPRDFWIKRLTNARKRLNASAAILSMQLASMGVNPLTGEPTPSTERERP